MNHTNLKFVLVVLFGIATTACVSIRPPEQGNFLSTYENLEAVSNDRLYYPGTRVGEYSRFIVDPTKMLFTQDPDKAIFTSEELTDLLAYFDEQIVEKLTQKNQDGPGYEIVEQPGEGVARLRIGLNDVQKTVGALNVLLYTKITGAGLGGASAEGELIDSITGEQLGAAVRWGTGSRVLRAGFTNTGDAKIAIKHWAKDLRSWIDYAHGRTNKRPESN